MAQPQGPAHEPLDLNNVRVDDRRRTGVGRAPFTAAHFIKRIRALDGTFGNFLFSDPNSGDDDNENWLPHIPLGQGGFGNVGLWVRRNHRGQIVREVVIKEADFNNNANEKWKGRDGLSHEAAIQAKLNSLPNSHTILHLLNYKWYSDERKIRFYLEYAPHGSLELLRLRYRVWDMYLPELFLWSIFRDLAQAIRVMKTGPRNWQPVFEGEVTRMGAASYVLHFDLKLQNVLLGPAPTNPDPANPEDQFPRAKVGDFGLAKTLRADSRDNPGWWGRGTRGFYPPEQNHYSVDWLAPIHSDRYTDGTMTFQQCANAEEDNATDHPEAIGFSFLEKFNVWGVGKIMHDLMTLALPDDVNDEMNLAGEARYYALFPGLVNRPLEHYTANLTTGNTPEYSVELRECIRRCLRPNMNHRYTSAQLLNETTRGLERCKQDTIHARGRRPRMARAAEKVYFAKTDINQRRSRGQGNFPATEVEWKRVRDMTFLDPDWPVPAPPRAKWAAQYAEPPPDPPTPHNWEVIGNQIHFRNYRGPRKRTRLDSYESGADPDEEMRDLIRTLRNHVLPLAGQQPVEFLRYILTNERMDAHAAQLIVEWLYADAHADWVWTRNANFLRLAREVNRNLPNRLRKECLYAVASSLPPDDRVAVATADLRRIFG